ncbi:MAG: hypothetical protein D6732_09005 [Methanobacteriota archaeon]|nr:MAG: hypothetical protein D6732_09005 [Euryarchaeota archaeon]
MKVYTHILYKGIFVFLLFACMFGLNAQTEEDDWACGFENAPEKQELLESLTIMQDTTLKVGLLLVQ